jgi:hypothetical protein
VELESSLTPPLMPPHQDLMPPLSRWLLRILVGGAQDTRVDAADTASARGRASRDHDGSLRCGPSYRYPGPCTHRRPTMRRDA